jgi:hypothetical protein
MNDFDTTIQVFLTHITFGPLMNHAIRVIAGLYTFKGFVLIPVLCWLWFQPGPRRERQRELVVATVASGLVALAVGRLLAKTLPFRVRPIYNPELHLHFPSDTLRAATLQAWARSRATTRCCGWRSRRASSSSRGAPACSRCCMRSCSSACRARISAITIRPT